MTILLSIDFTKTMSNKAIIVIIIFLNLLFVISGIVHFTVVCLQP